MTRGSLSATEKPPRTLLQQKQQQPNSRTRETSIRERRKRRTRSIIHNDIKCTDGERGKDGSDDVAEEQKERAKKKNR